MGGCAMGAICGCCAMGTCPTGAMGGAIGGCNESKGEPEGGVGNPTPGVGNPTPGGGPKGAAPGALGASALLTSAIMVFIMPTLSPSDAEISAPQPRQNL